MKRDIERLVDRRCLRIQITLLQGCLIAVCLFKTLSCAQAQGLKHDRGDLLAYQTERHKLNTEDAGPTEPGDYEVGFRYALKKSRHQFDSDGRQEKRGRLKEHAFDWGISVGLLPGADISAGFGYADIFDGEHGNDGMDGDGITDLEVASKILIYKHLQKNMAISFKPSLTLPTGEKSDNDECGPGDEYASFTQRLILSKNNGRWNFNLDSGCQFPFGQKRGDFRGSWETNAAIGYQICSWIQPAIELNYCHDFYVSNADSDTWGCTAELILSAHERYRIDIGFQNILAGRSTDQTMSAVVAVTFFL